MSPTLRQPSDRAELYSWHADALDALKTGRADNLRDLFQRAPELVPPITDSEPRCGWYAARVSRRAVLVPSRIWLQSVVGDDGELLEPETLLCEVGDRPMDAFEAWPKLCIRPIPVAQYRHLMALRQWARESAPDEPQAVDGRPIDWNTVKVRVPEPSAPQPKRTSRR
jgi:hypothetical protein